MRHFALWFIALWFFAACTTPKPKGGLPEMLEGKVATALKPLREVVDLAKKPSAQKTYRSFLDGNPDGPPEKQWTRVYILPSGLLRYREVYNVYKDQDGQIEYKVWEMDVNPTDTTRRQPARDYQCIINADTAYYGTLDQQYVHVRGRLDIAVGADTLKIFRMEGFAHAADIEPGHIKFWSPDLGTIMVWTGEGRTFEVTAVPGFDKGKLGVLLAAVKAEIN